MAKWSKKKSILRLFCLWFCFFCLTLGFLTTLARYESSASGSDSVTVAALVLGESQTLTVDTQNIAPGKSVNYTFGIQNFDESASAEVSMGYSITVLSTQNLPLNYKIKCNDTTGGTPLVAKDSTKNVTGGTAFSGAVLPYGSFIHTYTLTLSWNESNNDATYANEVEVVKIKIDSEQVD